LIIGLIVLGGVVLDWVSAYNDDGHFYTAVSIEHSHLPAFKEKVRDAAVVIGLCAELPDLSKEYDAVSLRVRLIPSVRGLLWGGFSSCWGEAVCHMVTVHHYLHALTDGAAETVTAAAIATLQALTPQGDSEGDLEPNRMCAAGFAVHLLGDSFAHRRLASPTRMYPPGMGHFRDDHNPDFILFNEQRTENYMQYARALDTAFKGADNPLWPQLRNILSQNRNGAALGNRYNEQLNRDGFVRTLRGDAPIWAPYNPTVQALASTGGVVLTRTCKEVLDRYRPPGGARLNCNKIWTTFKDAAIPEFERRGIPAVCPRDDKWSDGVSG
jgi:hypothetical protein